MASQQLTQSDVDALKAKCEECKAIFESAEGFAAAEPIDRQEVMAAIGDGTFWTKLPAWIVKYGPRMFAFALEILKDFIPQPTL